MKTKHISLIVLTLILMTGIALCVESPSEDNRPVIGISLDTTPLPTLLNIHLGLKTGQGIRIANIMKGSGADEQGLDRDDIVISLNGKDLYDRETLTEAVRKAGVGSEITIGVIHLGQRKEVTLKLKALKDTSGWKYQNEPEIEQTFKPGRIYRIDPNGQDWIQLFGDQVPGDIRSNINAMFSELYKSVYNNNGKQYSVTIEGNPNDNDSKITVEIDNDKKETTIGEINEMPEDYQEAAKNAVEKAKQKATNRFPGFSDEFGNSIMPRLRLNLNNPLMNTPTYPGNDPFFQHMEEQMRLMEERFMQLEESHQKLLEKLNENEQQ